ncbi:hypothetical protein U1Q18_005771 [Sarracenia purpurea var. burkii]
MKLDNEIIFCYIMSQYLINEGAEEMFTTDSCREPRAEILHKFLSHPVNSWTQSVWDSSEDAKLAAAVKALFGVMLLPLHISL